MQQLRTRRGSAFTVIEMVAALVIVSVLAAVSVVKMSAVSDGAHDNVAAVQVEQLLKAAEANRMLREATVAYAPQDALLTTTYYQAAEQLDAYRRPDVVAASNGATQVSFAISDDELLLGAAIRSESGRCVHGVDSSVIQPQVAIVGEVAECRAFVDGWAAAHDGFEQDVTASWSSTDNEPHRAPDGSIINRAPYAEDDQVSTAEATTVSFDATANDFDVDGDTVRVASVSLPTNGDAMVTSAGHISYTPAPSFHGTDTFGYDISDGRGARATAVVTVTVGFVNDAPVVEDDAASALRSEPVDVDVLANDIGDGELEVTAVTAPSSGRTAVNADSTVTYTPSAGFDGTDVFAYTVTDEHGASGTATVTVTVQPDNRPPVAAEDHAATGEDAAVNIDVLANDTDPDGDHLEVASVSQPVAGTVVTSGTAVLYTPARDFHGTEVFSYEVVDPAGATATGRVTVTVDPVNDVPTAAGDYAMTDQDRPVTVMVLDNDADADGDQLTVTAVSDPASGSTRVERGTAVTFVPADGYAGRAVFAYEVSDGNGGFATGTVTVEVIPYGNTLTVCQNPGDDQRTRVVKRDDAIAQVEAGQAYYGQCEPDGHVDDDEDPNGVTLCHMPGTPAEKTLTLPESATRGHYRHGDYAGACLSGK